MNSTEKLYKILKESKKDFFISVPCKKTSDIIAKAANDPEIIYTPVTREEEGIGIAAGAYLAGKKPVIIMQNSGIGNSVNAMCSLLNYYKIPIVFIISHRGSEGEKIDAQKPMGEATLKVLESIDINYHIISSTKELDKLPSAIENAMLKDQSIAFIFPIKYWTEGN